MVDSKNYSYYNDYDFNINNNQCKNVDFELHKDQLIILGRLIIMNGDKYIYVIKANCPKDKWGSESLIIDKILNSIKAK